MAGEGDGAGVGQPPSWRIPTVPEVEERSFNAAKVKEGLVKLGLPHKQHAAAAPAAPAAVVIYKRERGKLY